MNSKQRVKAVIEGRPADKVPLGFYVADCDTIERVIGRKTYVRNKIESQIAFWEGRRDEVVESYKKDTVEFYRKLDCVDIICFKEAPLVPPRGYEPPRMRRVDAQTWEDPEGRVFRACRESNDMTCVHDPRVQSPEEFSVEMFEGEGEPETPDPSVFEACDYLIENLGAERYIAGTCGGMIGVTLLGGMETGLMLYALKPEVVAAANRQQVALQERRDAFYIRPGQDGVLWEQDMASTKGPHVSPAVFRELCLPFMKQRAAQIRGRGQQLLLHNCGNNVPLMEMFIEAGVQCYQSLQTIPAMDIGGLTQQFGDRLAFWGGVPVELLVGGTPEQVRRCVHETMARCKDRGRLILGPSHSVAYGTRYDNFMAMLDEYAKLAYY